MAGDSELSKPLSMMLGQILDAYLHRDERKAAKVAGNLTFWRNGMLQQLEKIAAGNGDARTIAALRKNFKESEHRVEKAMEELQKVRDELGPSKIGIQIDVILNHDDIGKRSIRFGIGELLRDLRHDKQPDTEEFAEFLCKRIRALNAELERLNRMVRG